MTAPEPVYEHTDIPPGMTIAQYRRGRPGQKPAGGRPARRRRLWRRRRS